MTTTDAETFAFKCLRICLENDDFSTAALFVAELNDAEKVGLIGNQWRTEFDLQGLLNQVEKLEFEIEERWFDNYGYMFHLMNVGFGLIAEEFESFLSMRDYLELMHRYFGKDVTKHLRGLEEPFADFLRGHVKMARGGPDSLVMYLPNHWWWRANIERPVGG